VRCALTDRKGEPMPSILELVPEDLREQVLRMREENLREIKPEGDGQ
jgi:hypothetical protein